MADQEVKPIFPHVIDNSMIVTFRSCPRKFFNSYVLGLTPLGSRIDLVAGAAFAAGCEAVRRGVFEKGLSVKAALNDLAMPVFMKEWGDAEPHKRSNKSFANMWMALEQYFEEHPPLEDPFQPIMINGKCSAECTFSIPLPFKHPVSGEQLVYGGRFDLLAKYQGETLAIVDEKTTSRFGDTWADQWKIRSQFIGYCYAMQQYGYNISMAVVRGICILSRETKFATAITTYNQNLIDSWYKSLLIDIDRMLNYWQRMEDEDFRGYYPAYGDACTSYGNCQFVPLCTSQNPRAWFSNFGISHWNPLAKLPIAEDKP